MMIRFILMVFWLIKLGVAADSLSTLDVAGWQLTGEGFDYSFDNGLCTYCDAPDKRSLHFRWSPPNPWTIIIEWTSQGVEMPGFNLVGEKATEYVEMIKLNKWWWGTHNLSEETRRALIVAILHAEDKMGK